MTETENNPQPRQAGFAASRTMLRTAAIFGAVLVVSSLLIFFGSRNDATSVAQSIKSGVLTADEVNVAFETVGGRVTVRDIEESQSVKKGNTLMVLDATDLRISLARQKAVVSANRAALAQETEGIRIDRAETDRSEKTQWRAIEETEAGRQAAASSLRLAKLEFERAQKLRATGGVSVSKYDAAVTALKNAQSAYRQSERALASATIGATGEELARLSKTGSAEGMTLSAIRNARMTLKNRENTVASLQAALESSLADLEQLEVNIKRLTLTSPEDGIIRKILCEKGDMVSPNAAVVLLETNRRYFDIYVSEKQAPRFAPGTKVTAYVPALDKEVGGTVRFTNAADSFADLRMTRERGQADLTSFQVRIYIDNAPDVLTGMTLEVRQ